MATFNIGRKTIQIQGGRGKRGGGAGTHHAGGNPDFDETVVPDGKHHAGGNPRFDETTPSGDATDTHYAGGNPRFDETASPK